MFLGFWKMPTPGAFNRVATRLCVHHPNPPVDVALHEEFRSPGQRPRERIKHLLKQHLILMVAHDHRSAPAEQPTENAIGAGVVLCPFVVHTTAAKCAKLKVRAGNQVSPERPAEENCDPEVMCRSVIVVLVLSHRTRQPRPPHSIISSQ